MTSRDEADPADRPEDGDRLDAPRGEEPANEASDWIPEGIEDRIEETADRFLEELQGGARPDREAWIARYPELAPWLGRRLAVVALMHDAGRSASGVFRVRCPHCGSAVVLGRGDDHPEVRCSGCGSAFRVDAAMPPERGDLRIPDRVGRFYIQALLGRGSFGAVFKAFDPELDRIVAVKVPRAGTFASAQDEERFVREARSAASLRHPSIVPVHEIGDDGGMPYIVSAFIDGRTLADRIATNRPSFRESADIAARVADALHHAHGEGVVHRDVKPQNILLDSSGNPHVTDFGLARRDDNEVTVTLDGQILGTPAYMSPEQAAGDHARVGPATDVYSLGVVLYESLTGQRPFLGSSTMVLHQVLHEEPRPPRALNDHIPRDLETICLKALSKETSRRYPTAADLAADLRRHLRGEPIHARPVGTAERLARWCRRQPVTAGLVGTVALLLLAVAAVSAAMSVQSARSRDAVSAQLARLNVATGFRLVEEGDYIAALPWLAEGVAAEADRPARTVQFASALARCPRLSRVWFLERPAEQAELSPGADLAVLRAAGKVWVAATGTDSPPEPIEAAARIFRFALRPDGRTMATAGADGVVGLWSLPDGRPIREVRHSKAVGFVAFSPDGRHLVSCGSDLRARVWDVETGEAVGTPIPHARTIFWAAFSPDGLRLATACQDGRARVRSWRTGEPASPVLLHAAAVRHVAFRGDGLAVATASEDHTARAWDASTGRGIGGPIAHGNHVLRAEFGPRGDHLLTASLDGTAGIWRVEHAERIGTPMRHLLGVPFAAYAAGGRRIVTASFDCTARLWDAETALPVGPPLWHTDGLSCASVSDDGRWLLSASYDGSARLWDLAVGGGLLVSDRLETALNGAAISPAGDVLACAAPNGRLTVFDLTKGRVLHDRIAHPLGLNAPEFSPDGGRLVTASRDTTARVWDVRSGEPVSPPLAHGAEVESACFRSDGAAVLTCSDDGWARVWDAKTGAEIGPGMRHPLPVIRGAFRPDGLRVATSARDSVVRIWDPLLGTTAAALIRHEHWPLRLVFSPDGSCLATASRDGTAGVWDSETGLRVSGPLRHGTDLNWVGFSPDGGRVITASHDGTARVWAARTGEPLTPELSHGSPVLCADFSPDGARVLTGTDSGRVWVWDAASGEPLSPPLAGGSAWIVRAGFVRGGSAIASAARDGTVRLWELPERAVLGGETSLLSEVLSGRRIDPSGGPARLTSAEFRSRWEEIRRRAPGRLTATPQDIRGWNLSEAEACARNGDWPAALRHLDALVAARADDPRLHARRGGVLAELGRHEDAAEDFARAVRLGLESERLQFDRLHAVLAAGRDDEFRELSLAFVEKHRDSPLWLPVNSAAWIAAATPLCPADFGALGSRLAALVRENPRESSMRNTYGAVLYRAGRLEDAISELGSSIELQGNEGSVWDWLFLAMAHRRLGRLDEASTWMARSRPSLAGSPPGGTPLDWRDRLLLGRLAAEAESVMQRP